MSTTPQPLADALKNLETQVVESYVDGWKSYWKLVSDVARDPSSLPTAQKEYLTHLTQTAPAQLSKTLQASAQVYGALLHSGTQLATQLYTQTANQAAQTIRDAGDVVEKATESYTAPVTPSEFLFEGCAGETLERRFLVSNKSPQPCSVALQLTSFTPDPGSVSLQMNLVPQSFSLGANQDQIVACSVTIPASLPPLQSYRAALSAPGIPSLSIGLNVKSLGVGEVVIEDDATA